MKAGPVEAGDGQDSAEFSRLVSIEDLNPGMIERRYEASAEECAALARRFGITALRKLVAEAVLRRKGRSDLIRLEGRLSAEVEQPCVATLEPVIEGVEESFELRFTLDPVKAAGESAAAGAADVVIDPEADDPPELVGPKGIDVGEVIAQQLSVAINPYPRLPDAVLEEEVLSAGPDSAQAEGAEAEVEGPAKENPFAVLKLLKSGEKDGDS